MKPLCYSVWTLLPVLTAVFDADAKKRRKKPKPKKQDPVLFRDRSTSPCLPSALLPLPLPPPPPPVTTVASVVAASPSVYTMPRVFGPFPPVTSKPVSGNLLYSRWSWEGRFCASVLPTAVALRSLQKGSSQTGFGYGLAIGQTDKRGLPWPRATGEVKGTEPHLSSLSR